MDKDVATNPDSWYTFQLMAYWMVFGIVGWFAFAFGTVAAAVSLAVPSWNSAALSLVVVALIGLLLGISLIVPLAWFSEDEPTTTEAGSE